MHSLSFLFILIQPTAVLGDNTNTTISLISNRQLNHCWDCQPRWRQVFDIITRNFHSYPRYLHHRPRHTGRGTAGGQNWITQNTMSRETREPHTHASRKPTKGRQLRFSSATFFGCNKIRHCPGAHRDADTNGRHTERKPQPGHTKMCITTHQHLSRMHSYPQKECGFLFDTFTLFAPAQPDRPPRPSKRRGRGCESHLGGGRRNARVSSGTRVPPIPEATQFSFDQGREQHKTWEA